MQAPTYFSTRFFLFILTLLLLPQPLRAGDDQQGAMGDYDVVIAGAGTGGIAAAIQAARMGMNVALLETTDWVGGQATAAGVTSFDQGGFIPATGIYGEFIARVKDYYTGMGLSMSTCYYSNTSWCFEPRVGRQIYKDMLDAAGVHFLPYTTVVQVFRDGKTVTGGIVAQQSQPGDVQFYKFSSRILIDATEYGDLLPLANIPYRVGNSTSNALNPSACVQAVTYTTVMKKYPEGAPAELRADLIGPPPGYTPGIVNYFAWWVTKDAPLVFTSGQWVGSPSTWTYQLGYRGMPDSSVTPPVTYTGIDANLITRTGVNNTNDYPYTVADIENPVNRQNTNCKAKLRTLQFLYYVQHDLGETSWAVANDEGYDTPYNIQMNSCPNIPPEYKAIEKYLAVMPYVRESRRMIGIKTLTGKDIYRVNHMAWNYFPSSVAVADYNVDMHGCNTNATLEQDLQETLADAVPRATGRFQIPLETLIPQDTDGFLAAEKNISQSRMVNGATRLQPSTMYIGQAAGAVAAYAVKNNLNPRDINPQAMQTVLANTGQPVSHLDFRDVPPGNPSWAGVQVASASQFMTGQQYGVYFGASAPISRREAALAFERKFSFLPSFNGNRNLFTAPEVSDFADVAISDLGYSAIEKLFRDGLTSGCAASPRRFCPDEPLTNMQMAFFVTRLLKLDSANPTQLQFSDVAGNYYAYPAINAVVAAGLMDAPSGNFSPLANLSRGKFASILASMNFLKLQAVYP